MNRRPRLAAAALLLALAFAGPATVRAQVVPLLDDTVWLLDINGVTAFFGYNNSATTEVNVPFGQYNFFLPSPPFRGQPTIFSPGVVPRAFSVTFPASSYVEWTLGTEKLRVTVADVTDAITGSSITRSTTSTYPKLTVTDATQLTLAGGTHTATNGVFLGAGSTLRLESGVLDTPSIALTDTGSATLQFAHAATSESPFYFTRDGTVSGTTPTVTGAIQLLQTSGHTVLTGSLAHTGGTVIDGGTLELAAPAGTLPSASTVTVNGGTLLLSGSDQTLASLSGTGGAVQLSNARTLTLTDPAAATFAGTIDGNGALAKTGAGTLTLTGANTYSGGTTLTAGTLLAGHDTALGTGTLTLNGGTLGATGGARTLANAVVLNADATFTGAHALTLTGNVTLARTRELTIDATAPVTISGVISGAGRSLNKFGAGELILTGANTYTGGTFIEAGILRINNATGSALGTGAVTIGPGATLTGAGTFSGALQNNGTYAPGNSPTLSTLASFNQGQAGLLEMEIAGLTRGTGYDALDVTGALAFDGTLQVSFIDGFTAASFTAGTTFNLFDWGSASGTFSTLNLPDLSAYGFAWDTSALYTTGELSVSAVPEPSTYAAFAGLAALGLVALGRRRRRSRSLGEG